MRNGHPWRVSGIMQRSCLCLSLVLKKECGIRRLASASYSGQPYRKMVSQPYLFVCDLTGPFGPFGPALVCVPANTTPEVRRSANIAIINFFMSFTSFVFFHVI